MRTLKTALLLTLPTCFPVFLGAVVLVDDGFNVGGTNEYTAGNVAGQNPSATGSGWSAAWNESLGGTGLRFLGTSSTSLAYTDSNNQALTAVNAGSAGALEIQSTGSGFGNTNRSLSSNISGTAYFSFLIDAPTAPSTSFGITLLNGSNGRYFINRGNSDTDNIRLGMNVFDGGATIFGADSSAKWTEAEFMVGRITGIGTNNTTFDLWVNPSDLSNIGGSAATISLNVTTAGSASINGFNVGFASGDDGTTIDDLRIGESFADVAPFTVVPEPSSFALLSGMICLGLIVKRRRK